MFHANALCSPRAIRGTTNDQDEASVGIKVGLGNLVYLIDGAADQTPRGRVQTSHR